MNKVVDTPTRQLAWWRWSGFLLGCAAFFLSFFHRVCTGAIAGDLQREFEIGAAARHAQPDFSRHAAVHGDPGDRPRAALRFPRHWIVVAARAV